MRHKYLVIIAFFVIIFSSDIYAKESEFIGKIGTAWAADAEKLGLDVGMSYYYKFDPYFVAGAEFDFFWIRWDRKIGDEEVNKDFSGERNATTNAYTIPIFFNAQVRLPNLASKIYFEPSFTVGLLWSMMVIHNSVPDEDVDEANFYSGFAWQCYVSGSLKPDKDSSIAFILDLGYRGLSPEKDNVKFNMSGFLARVGVKFTI